MDAFPLKLQAMLEKRGEEDRLRQLVPMSDLVDFSSNDYLGLARRPLTENARPSLPGGSTGSRLIRGNHPEYARAEQQAASFHGASAALIFNSGYDANLGLLAAVPQRSDYLFYDEEAHASLRDGARLSQARSYSFRHNSVSDLEERLQTVFATGRPAGSEVYVVTESVFSMSGDGPDLEALVAFCAEHDCHLILDEAHAAGILGPQGRGLGYALGQHPAVFARIITYGKAFGSHGAAVLGSEPLKQFLVNFCRSFIYTTALPPESLKRIRWAYSLLESPEGDSLREAFFVNTDRFRQGIRNLGLESRFCGGPGAIFNLKVGGNTPARQLSAALAAEGYDVRAILSPTVAPGSECLRFCLHSFNTEAEITGVLRILAKHLTKAL